MCMRKNWQCCNTTSLMAWSLLVQPLILTTRSFVFWTIKQLLMSLCAKRFRWLLHTLSPLRLSIGKDSGGNIIFTIGRFEDKSIWLATSSQTVDSYATFQSNFWIMRRLGLTIFHMLRTLRLIFLVLDFLRCPHKRTPQNKRDWKSSIKNNYQQWSKKECRRLNFCILNFSKGQLLNLFLPRKWRALLKSHWWNLLKLSFKPIYNQMKISRKNVLLDVCIFSLKQYKWGSIYLTREILIMRWSKRSNSETPWPFFTSNSKLLTALMKICINSWKLTSTMRKE